MSLVLEMRPKTLDELVGQEHIKPTVRKCIERRCQRWLFHGPTGTGKTTLARIVAREYGAEPGDTHEFNAAELGIEEIGEIVQMTGFCPMMGKYRVIILDEAQALTEAAKSALLKPLENDDLVNVWILCTMEVEELHRALRDRCTSFKLKGMGPQERRDLVARAAKHLGYPDDTNRFLRELDAKEVYSARDILGSFEKYADGMRADDALA